jgi:serine/threonine protein kinase
MRSGLASVRDERGLDSVDRAVRTLEDEWHHGEPMIERHWGEHAPDGSISVLAALVKTDLRCRYSRGERPEVATYLERFPVLRDQSDRALSLIYEEFCLREEHGEHPDADQFCARYPSWRDSLASQLRYHRVLSQVVAPSSIPPRFPEPGEYFDAYQLDRVLGKGGAAQVYLARDKSLGGRPVAVKISTDRGKEHEIMGRLDHAHIVPILSVAFQTETQLRGLIMPFRPGSALDEIIKRIHAAPGPRTARTLWEAVLETAKKPDPEIEPGEVRSPVRLAGWDGYPMAGSYSEGVAWVIAALARALAYAHERGILHRDVKPANILMTRRDGPQLLDFNLSHDPHSASQAAAAMRGGTLPYMAPEQLEAFLDSERWDDVDASADLYSLGLVMCEMLTGRPPDTPGPNLPHTRAIRELLDRRLDARIALRRFNPTIPHALEAIAERCLASIPADRYPDASALADDLERFLDRRPLAYAFNPSRSERSGNWLWRRRRLAVPVVSLCMLGCLFLTYRTVRKVVPVERLPDFQKSLDKIDKCEYEKAVPTLRSLVEERPESPLVQAYLSIALFRTGDVRSAGIHITQALISPTAKEADAELTAWGRRHPSLAQGLEALAQDLTDKPNAYKTLPLGLYQLLERIDPESRDYRFGAAMLFTACEKYAEAESRWNRTIQETEQDHNRLEDQNLLKCYLQRAINAVSWAEHQLEGGSVDVGRLLHQALDDCSRGRQYLTAGDPEHPTEYDLTEARALLQLTRLETRPGRRGEAEKTFKRARSILQGMAAPTDQPWKSQYEELRKELDDCRADLSCTSNSSRGALARQPR